MSPQGRLFGTNGVRFKPGVDADLEFVLILSECIGTYFSEGDILVGRDGRLSGEAISLMATSGLMSSGRNVAEAGLVPTPALQFATKTLGYRGGIMVTASHNPAEYNGIKVVGADGVEIPRLDEQKIEHVYHDRSIHRANWGEVGTSRSEPSAIRLYLQGILSKVNGKLISGRKFSIVVDPGNGAQCLAAPYLLEMLGCRVITINSIVDGRFPARGPEPTPETLKDLSAAVRASRADLGVAYDGDGDRAIFCDETGLVYWGDQSGSLIADYLLERNAAATIVTPVSSSQVVEMVAAKHRAKVIRTRVGSVDVSRTMMERGAFFGFEENGGCIYPAHIAVRDGGMATALMLECLAAKGLTFSRTIGNAFPRFFQAKIKIPTDPEKARSIMKAVERQAAGRVEKVDGVKVWTDDKTWVLVRASGTEPIIRIFGESDTEEKVNSVLKKFSKIVKSAQAS
ncbi:MAG: phosphoglucosamine mutase [Thaumarchaeota archaeon]|nr:phosphoglucosamine mutase [Nitrososphaerota archaeon]